jgi:hypothetical protein
MLFANDESLQHGLARLSVMEYPLLMFYNEDKTFRILLRMIVEDKTLELGICSFTNDIEMPRVMKEIGFPSGYYDSEVQCFFLSEYTNVLHDIEAIKHLRGHMNALYKATVCPCGERLVYDPQDHTHCCFCQMVSTNKEEDMCCICHSASGHTMTRMECCLVAIHTQCLATWFDSKGGVNVSCPLCRHKVVKCQE